MLHNHCLWQKKCMHLGWSKGFQVHMIFSNKGMTKSLNQLFLSVYAYYMRQRKLFFKHQTKFSFNPQHLELGLLLPVAQSFNWLFCSYRSCRRQTWVQVFIRERMDNYSVPAITKAVRAPHPIDIFQCESHRYIG